MNGSEAESITMEMAAMGPEQNRPSAHWKSTNILVFSTDTVGLSELQCLVNTFI